MQIARHAGLTQERPVKCGLGKCRICSCWAFKGGGDICEDCTHHYDDHATKPFHSAVEDSNHNVLAAQE